MLLLTALLLPACGAEAGDAAGGATVREDRHPAAERQATEVKIEEESDLLSFKYSFPAEAAAISAIDRQLRADADRQLSDMREMAVAERKSRKEMKIDFHPLGFEANWIVLGSTDELLSLAAQVYAYTGGAHGNTHYDSIIWDREMGKSVKPLALFSNPTAALNMLQSVFCPRLDAMRAEKRDEALPLQGEGWMVDCPTLEDRHIVPVDTDGDSRFEILRVLLPPYDAGPYAEGAYEVDIPVTDDLKAMMKPEYRSAF